MLSTERTPSQLGDKIYYTVAILGVLMILLGLFGKAMLFIINLFTGG